MVLLIERSAGFEMNFDLTRVNADYISIASKVLVDHFALPQVEDKPSSLRSETEELKRFAKTLCALHCSSALYTLKFHLPDRLVKDLERFGNM